MKFLALETATKKLRKVIRENEYNKIGLLKTDRTHKTTHVDRTGRYVQMVPIYHQWPAFIRRYSGADLRKLRSKKGVGPIRKITTTNRTLTALKTRKASPFKLKIKAGSV